METAAVVELRRKGGRGVYLMPEDEEGGLEEERGATGGGGGGRCSGTLGG
jgi:hypothetical protein